MHAVPKSCSSVARITTVQKLKPTPSLPAPNKFAQLGSLPELAAPDVRIVRSGQNEPVPGAQGVLPRLGSITPSGRGFAISWVSEPPPLSRTSTPPWPEAALRNTNVTVPELPKIIGGVTIQRPSGLLCAFARATPKAPSLAKPKPHAEMMPGVAQVAAPMPEPGRNIQPCALKLWNSATLLNSAATT